MDAVGVVTFQTGFFGNGLAWVKFEMFGKIDLRDAGGAGREFLVAVGAQLRRTG